MNKQKISIKSAAHILICLLAIQLIAVIPAFAASRDCTLENDYLRREIKSDGGVHTTLFANKLTGRRYDIESEEFRLSLDNGALEMRSSDFPYVTLKSSPGQCDYELRSEKLGITVRLKYELEKDKFWSRKWLEIEAGEHIINEVEVERFRIGGVEVERFDTEHESNQPWNWPGGRPLFIDRQLFAGLEYPAGYNEVENGVIKLHHYPGSKGHVVSKAAVIGVAADQPNRRVEDAFAEYISRIRIHPPRRFILWNAYFHKYEGDGSMAEMFSEADLKRKFIAGKKTFTDVGVQPDCVLIDGGWADPKSLMEENHRAPRRVKLVRELADKYIHAPIGVHVISHGRRGSIDNQWLKDHFDMIAERTYCFADPRAADMEIKNLLDDQKRHNIVAFKFDWGCFTCKQTNHRGHLPGERYAREAITENHIRMLTALHRASPDAYLYNTGWYSAWWLMYYDAVFSGENDYNVSLVGPPSFYINDLQETWRDAVIRRNIIEPRAQFPLNALMNHSPVSFKWQHDYYRSEQGSLDSFANAILMNYLRGNGLIEMYMNVFNLSDEERRVWGDITRWAKANDHVLLADSKFLGGEPFKGEVYGYAHFNNLNEGIIGLRNPGILSKNFSFVLDEKIGFRSDGKLHGIRIAYPYETWLGTDFKYGDTVNLENLERGGVIVLEVKPAAEHPSMQPESAVRTGAEKPNAEKIKLNLADGSVSGEYNFSTPSGKHAGLVILSTMDSFKEQKNVRFEAEANGASAKVQRVENCSGEQPHYSWEPHDGWVIHIIELPEGKSAVKFNLTAPGAKNRGWLMSLGTVDNSLPVFKSGLPAAWKDSVKTDLDLF